MDVGGDLTIWCIMFIGIAIWLGWKFKTGKLWVKLRMQTAIALGAYTACIWGLVANRVFVYYWFLNDLEGIESTYLIPLSGPQLSRFQDGEIYVDFSGSSIPLRDAVVCDGSRCFGPILES